MASTIPAFRLLLSELADHITSANLSKLKYLCSDIPARRLEEIRTPEGLFTAIGERQGSEEAQLQYIGDRLDTIGLKNLKRKIEEHRIRENANQEGITSREEAPHERRPAPLEQIGQRGPKESDEEVANVRQTGNKADHPVVDSPPHTPVEQLATTVSALTVSDAFQTPGSENPNLALPDPTPDPAIQGSNAGQFPASTTQQSHAEMQGPLNPGNQSHALPPRSSSRERDCSYVRQSSSRPIPVSSTSAQRSPAHLSYDEMKQYFEPEETPLAKGGFGDVYRGSQKYMEQDVVVKKERMQDNLVYDQFKREKKLSYIKHSCIMPIYAICEEKGKPRCIMYPFMVNFDLDHALQRDGRSTDPFKLPWKNRIRIALHTARGLRYLHSQNIVHMDIKPGNILLDESFNGRLGDPGLARQLKPGYTHASVTQLCGTPGYIDPFYERSEQFRPSNDIFSFGVVLLRMLTQKAAADPGKPTLYQTLKKSGAFESPEELYKEARKGKWPDPALGKEFAALVIGCLKDPKERIGLDELCKRFKKMVKMEPKPLNVQDRERETCVSCMLETPKKFLDVKSSSCRKSCNYFCQSCLIKSRRNPLECPEHGPADPAIGHQNTFAFLICGNDRNNPEIFEKDARELYEVLNDNRIIGIRQENIFLIMPNSNGGSEASEVKKTLEQLKRKLECVDPNNARLFFYFSGHSDQNGNLVCGSDTDILQWDDLQARLNKLQNLGETIIILDCCYADNKIATDLLQKGPADEPDAPNAPQESSPTLLPKPHRSFFPEESDIVDGSPEAEKSGADATIAKAPPGPRREPASVWQMSSSTRNQESLALQGGNSIFTKVLVQGLRGGHQCQEPKCRACEMFQGSANHKGYISVCDLETFIYDHVDSWARRKGRRQQPRSRSAHSRDIPLAYFNEAESLLHDHVPFTFEDGHLREISVTPFPETIEKFREAVHNDVKGDLKIASVKHIQILCEDDEVDSQSYSDLKQRLRGGYGVRCQMRLPEDILKGPVTWAIQDAAKYTELFRHKLAKVLGIAETTESQQHPSFSLHLPQTSQEEEDKEQFIGMVSDLKDSKVLQLFHALRDVPTTGSLIVTMFEKSVHFEFQIQNT